MQRESLTYEWNDVALLVDQRAYTIISKTMLQIPQQQISEIQDVLLFDWTWKREVLCDDEIQKTMTPFQGMIVVQIIYLNDELQQEHVFVEVPIQGAWQEPLTQQNAMRLVFQHTQMAEEHLLLELVLQVNRSQPLERSQVLIGQFQLEEQIILEQPWPACDDLLATSVVLQVQDWQIVDRQLQFTGQYQMVLIYQNESHSGEHVFVYEQRLPMEATILVPEGLQELSGIVPYYQNLTAQVLDEQCIQLMGNGVFCTLPCELCTYMERENMQPDTEIEAPLLQQAEKYTAPHVSAEKEQSPSVVNRRGSRKANLSKYMRDLNNSVETPTSVRNFELGMDSE